jgi:hypothetical protein
MVETPYWTESGCPIDGPDQLLAKALLPAARSSAAVEALLDRHLPALQHAGGVAVRPLLASLLDMRASVARRARYFANPPDRVLTAASAGFQRRVAQFHLLRPVATLARLAALMLDEMPGYPGALAATVEAQRYLANVLDNPEFLSGIAPVPLKQSVGLQVCAGLATAAALAQRQRQ